jgi:hypothetical protein
MQKEKLTLIDRFNKNYPKILTFIDGFSGVTFSFLKTIITSIGLLIVLILLLVVEVNRVKFGVAYFEVVSTLAFFSAVVLVMANVLIEFQIHYIEAKGNYTKPAKSAFSLRLTFESLKYRLGIGEDWTPKSVSPADTFITVQKIVTITIMALAFAGSMRSDVLTYEGLAWYDAIGELFSSDLNTVLTWFGGFLFTLSAVFSAQIIARYIAEQASSIETNIKKQAVQVHRKEQGVVEFSGLEAKAKWRSFKPLKKITKADIIQVEPEFRFFDSVTEKWVGPFKSSAGLKNRIKIINRERM